MKKIIIFIAGAILMMACGGKSAEEGISETEGVEFDSIVVDTTVSLTSENGSPTAKLHLSLMFATRGEKIKEINDTLLHSGLVVPDYLSDTPKGTSPKAALDTFLVRFASDYKRNYAPLYQRDRENKSSYDVTLQCKATIRNFAEGIINYQVETFNMAGGKYATQWTLSHNIDVKTGRIVSLDDIIDPTEEKELKKKMIEAMMEKYDCDNLEELREKGIFVGIEPYVTRNVIIKDGALELIYVDSEIAPHDMGEIRVEVKR